MMGLKERIYNLISKETNELKLEQIYILINIHLNLIIGYKELIINYKKEIWKLINKETNKLKLEYIYILISIYTKKS